MAAVAQTFPNNMYLKNICMSVKKRAYYTGEHFSDNKNIKKAPGFWRKKEKRKQVWQDKVSRRSVTDCRRCSVNLTAHFLINCSNRSWDYCLRKQKRTKKPSHQPQNLLIYCILFSSFKEKRKWIVSEVILTLHADMCSYCTCNRYWNCIKEQLCCNYWYIAVV